MYGDFVSGQTFVRSCPRRPPFGGAELHRIMLVAFRWRKQHASVDVDRCDRTAGAGEPTGSAGRDCRQEPGDGRGGRVSTARAAQMPEVLRGPLHAAWTRS